MATLYDWKRWFKARRFSLIWGRDFVCSPIAMVQMVRNKASRANLRVRTALSDDWREIRVKVQPRARARRLAHAV